MKIDDAAKVERPTGTAHTGDGKACRLVGTGLAVGYGDSLIIEGLNIAIPSGEFTVIVGPNASGKSTLLKALARMLPARQGRVELDGQAIESFYPKEIARRLGLLPQSPVAPEGILVEDLVARGRYPHQGIMRQWDQKDEDAVARALERAGVEHLRERRVDQLSGGQRQRVWVALTLAQQTPILLLDEPTTYLDISHQIEILNLARSLQGEGYTVVAVLHELNMAFRYATRLIVMSEGTIVAQGPPEEVVTAALIEEVFGVPCQIIVDPMTGSPLVIPERPDVLA